ncbi:MAG: ABC transporter substrate-binding protein, partial [Anaerolineae bacterium]
MFTSKRLAALVALVMIFPLVLAACGPTPEPEVIVQTVVVEQTKVVEVEGEVQTIIETVVETVEVEVTAVPEGEPPAAEGVFVAPDPTTYTYITFGDIDTMDPNLCYDTASAAPMLNVMEGLLFFNREKMTEYVPVLATEIPSVENGGISADGLTYVFNIRQGVKFHNGNDLTPSDFEYTFERGLLQSDPNGPQWLLIEPLMGYASGGITEEIADGAYEGDPDALKANATPEELLAVCEKVKA